ncbi:lonely Cys domain-containing protein [Streptomyces sp. FXJ1.4098]|nr:lonely Cys domain-containing protein [Streptomyces sp. FXJ1.4098]
MFPLEDGTVYRAYGAEGARYLAHHKSSQALGEDDWNELLICWAGSPADRAVPSGFGALGRSFPGPFVPDPLADVPMGQHVANETRHKTNALIRLDGVGLYQNMPFRILATDRQGRRQWFQQFYPEPDAAELDRRVREAGYYTGPQPPAWAREHTLRLVRALKLTLGNDVDDGVQVGQDPEYAELLRGAAALDRMRMKEPQLRGTGPFTLDLFRRIVEARLPAGGHRRVRPTTGRTEGGGRRPRRYEAERLRDTAVVGGPGGRVESHGGPVRGGRQGPAYGRLDHALRGRVVPDVLARVKTYEALDTSVNLDELTAQLYDLPSAGQVDDAGRDFTRELMTTAYAIGLDGSDPAVLYAYHLDTLGAVADPTALHAPGTPNEVSGRDYRPGPKDAFPDLSKIRTPSGVRAAPWRGRTRGRTRPGRRPMWCGPRWTRRPRAACSCPSEPSPGV